MKKILLAITVILSPYLNAQKNQNEYIKDLTTGSYSVFKTLEKGYNKTVFVAVKKKWPIEVTSNDGRIEKVLVKRAGIVDENFIVDLPSHPAYFGFNDLRVTYIDGLLYYYKWSSKNKAEIKYVLTNKGKTLSGRINDYKLELEKYIIAVSKNQKGAKEDRKVEKEAEKEADRLANSLQNKKPTKIEFQLAETPLSLGMGSIVKYGIIATLADGSIHKTPNLGGKLPWSDFIIKIEGGTPTQEETMVLEDGSLIPKDQLIFNITSKYHSNISLTHAINLRYDKDISIDYSDFGLDGRDGAGHALACSGCSANGGNGNGAYKGKNLTISVQENTTPAGISYNKITVTDSYSGNVLHKFKIGNSNNLIISNPGGRGGNGGDGAASDGYSANGGNGGEGGDGGDIIITKSDNVVFFNYKAQNYGGYGGGAGDGEGSPGSSGTSGKSGNQGLVIENYGSVNINW